MLCKALAARVAVSIAMSFFLFTNVRSTKHQEGRSSVGTVVGNMACHSHYKCPLDEDEAKRYHEVDPYDLILLYSLHSKKLTRINTLLHWPGMYLS